MRYSKNSPLVSVIIPAFNRADTIERAINSVLYQTYEDLELIVVDDASSDHTNDIINELKSKDPRIIYIKHTKNMGAAVARNTGIKNHKGEYIAFLDSDDLWLPDKLEKQLNAIDRPSPNIGVVYSSVLRVEAENVFFEQSFKGHKSGYIYKDLLYNNFIPSSAILVRGSCFDEIGLWDDNLTCFQDWDLVLRLSKNYEFIYLPDLLVIQYDQRQSITNIPKGRDIAALYLMEKYCCDINDNNKILSNFQILIAKNAFLNKRYNRSLIFFLKGIYNNPYKLKNYMVMLSSFLGISNYQRIRKSYRRVFF